MVFCLQGRAADQKAVIPLALLAGCLAAVNEFLREKWPAWGWRWVAFVAGALLYGILFLNSFLYTNQVIKPLPAGFHEGVEWIKNGTPAASSFMVITGQTWETDKYSEWITTLTGRRSANVVQGYEWLPGFSERILRYDQANAAYAEGLTSFLQWIQANDLGGRITWCSPGGRTSEPGIIPSNPGCTGRIGPPCQARRWSSKMTL